MLFRSQAANRLAHFLLRQRGHEPEPVALLVDYDAPTIAAILGILKAGKICVPFDPSYPETRAAYILGHSQARVIVSSNKKLSSSTRIPMNAQQLINLDEIDTHLPAENVGLKVSPDIFAFILYTSGSTGNPKGVIQNHRNILHWTLRTTNGFHIGADDRVSLLASLGGGQAVATAFNALLNGATLCAFNIKEEGMTHLANWLITERITLYISASTIFREFVGTLTEEEKFPKLRLVRLGAERVRKSDVKLYQKYFSPQSIFGVMLSSAETGALCQYFLNKETEITGETVPVGYAVDDVEILLLNDSGAKVGFNEIGEIAVRSRYLTPGYWRMPDLTQRFLPDQNGGDERVYLTGDLGLMRPDGCLEHLGRKDFRVKIRGFRIELEEVETALRLHPAVREAVAGGKENRSGDNILVAYVVVDKSRAPTISELRKFLSEKLPEYMVPSRFVFLDALPLAPNGKVDRGALPIPGQNRPELENLFVEPRTPIEEALARIWTGVLQLEQIGVHDNFFDLGGHSLLATQVISRVRDTFQVELPLRTLFEKPTVADLAVQIAEAQAKKAVPEKMTDLLTDLDSLSDEEAQRLLAQENSKRI